MADFLETNLKKLAEFQKKHARVLAISMIIITLVLGVGLKNLSINSEVVSTLDKPIKNHALC